jgi:hypothetical protein
MSTNPTKSRWIKIGVVLVVAALGCAGVLVATHWPFTRGKVILSLEQNYGSTVEFKTFRVTYFPAGCVAEGVTFRRNANPGAPPIATIAKLTVQGSYPGFFMLPKRIPRVTMEGLHVFASPQSERAGNEPAPAADQVQVVVGEMVADGAILEFSSGKPGAVAQKFDIHKLTLNNVSDDRSMSFHAALRNPTPPGEIRADGQFGPLRRDNPGQTAASGSYVFEQADLGVFPGIGGTLSSTGKFGGVLEQMEVAGSTDVPDFNVTTSGHTVHLKTQFQATVNGIDGDVALRTVSAQFGHTTLLSRGEVASKANSDGKRVTVAGNEQQGTIQDWLRLFAKADHPAMTGAMTFHAQVQVPSGERDFIHRVSLQGDFVIGVADFTAPDTQKAVNNLSQVALGQKQNDDPALVAENMKGRVEMQDATATFADLYFGVPGALAHVHGTYGILTQKIDLHGNLRVDNKLSKGSTGIKAVLLKVAEPFLKKKNAGEIVPIKIEGSFSEPSYGLDLTP